MTTLGLILIVAAFGSAIPAGIWWLSWRLDIAEFVPPSEIATSRRKAAIWSGMTLALACLAWWVS
jgi:hypothetical protein